MKKEQNQTIYRLPENRYKCICDLMLEAPHILIGGTTGSGKSVLIDALIYTIITTKTPQEAHLCFCDPKRVTFTKYRHLPHVERLETEPAEIIQLLREVVETMENRYKRMHSAGVVDYDGTAIYIVIDEIADLMTTCKKEIVPIIQRVAQLGRASNIHLICATQCPNRKIIPAELTVNFGGRVALRCLNAIESRQILNTKGAETLPRYGTCIYLHSDGCYYTGEIPYFPDEIQRTIDFWLKQGTNKKIFKKTPCVVNPQKSGFSLIDALRGGKRLPVSRESRDDIETLNILSLIDDD